MEKNKIILDTSAYSAYLRGNSEIKLSIQQADEIFLNPVILGELLAGFIMGKSERRTGLYLKSFFLPQGSRLLILMKRHQKDML